MHILVGALVGAVVGVAIAVIAAKAMKRPISWRALAVGAAGGAIAGAVTVATLGAGGSLATATVFRTAVMVETGELAASEAAKASPKTGTGSTAPSSSAGTEAAKKLKEASPPETHTPARRVETPPHVDPPAHSEGIVGVLGK